MTEQLINSQALIIKMRLSVYLFAATILLGNGHNLISSAKAQTETIKLDLSVIQDSGLSGFGPTSRTNLKIPPKENPISQLHISPQKPGGLKLGTPQQNVRIIEPKTKKETMNAAPSLATPSLVTAPAPTPVPIKKVIKALAVPVPPSIPKPLSLTKNRKEVAGSTSTPVLKKAASSAPPLPPKLARAPEPLKPKAQISQKGPSTEIALGQTIQIEFEETATKLP